MAKDKSLMEKFADTVRDVAKAATDAAGAALKPETSVASKLDERTAGYVPLAADGLVSDPMMATAMARPHPRRKKRAAKRVPRTPTRKRANKSVRKPSAKSAKRSASRKSGRAASRKTPRMTKNATKRRAAKSRRR